VVGVGVDVSDVGHVHVQPVGLLVKVGRLVHPL
jgi:hypothetical protein